MKPKCGEPLCNIAFKFNLRHYTWVGNGGAMAWAPGAPAHDGDDTDDRTMGESEEFVEATPPLKRSKR